MFALSHRNVKHRVITHGVGTFALFTQRTAYRVFARKDSRFHTGAFTFSHIGHSESARKLSRLAGANHGSTQTLTLFNTKQHLENDQAGSLFNEDGREESTEQGGRLLRDSGNRQMKLWKINCTEESFPGMRQRWYRNQCVAVGWHAQWGYPLSGRLTAEHYVAAVSRAQSSLQRIEPGDHIIVSLRGNRVGRLREVTGKAIEDDD
jgi:hypothetical protein